MATPSPGTIFLVGTVAAIAGYAAFFRPKPTPRKKGSGRCNPAPFTYDRAAVINQIDGYLNAGQRNVEEIAVDVATDLFTTYPADNSAVTYPPTTNPALGLPRQGVQCVFERVTSDVIDRMAELGLEPGGPTGSPVSFGTGDWGSLGGAANYPWEQPLIETNNYPTPGMFFIVGQPTKQGNSTTDVTGLAQLGRMAVASALAMAGNAKSNWNTPGNSNYSNKNAQRLRQQMRDLLICSPYNDHLFGQNDKVKAGNMDYAIGPNGRGLNWLPNHADNIGRLAAGQDPIRTTTLDGKRMSTLPPGVTANRNMQLWIPPVNLSMLTGSDETLTISTAGMQWSDGSSVINPPPAVSRKNIISFVTPSNGWGCP